MRLKFSHKSLLAILALLTPLTPTHAGIIFSFEAAGIQNATATGTVVENFNGFATGAISAPLTTAIGTITGTGTISNANVYGGAGGSGKYVVPTGNGFTETFSAAQGFFGLWWSAGNAANYLSINTVDGSVYSFSTQSILTSGLLTAAYKGNPNPSHSGDTGEYYAFIDFFATDAGSKITSVKLSGSGFESDNYTIAAAIQAPTGTTVSTSGSVPEPALLSLLGLGLLFTMGKKSTKRFFA